MWQRIQRFFSHFLPFIVRKRFLLIKEDCPGCPIHKLYIDKEAKPFLHVISVAEWGEYRGHSWINQNDPRILEICEYSPQHFIPYGERRSIIMSFHECSGHCGLREYIILQETKTAYYIRGAVQLSCDPNHITKDKQKIWIEKSDPRIRNREQLEEDLEQKEEEPEPGPPI